MKKFTAFFLLPLLFAVGLKYFFIDSIFQKPKNSSLQIENKISQQREKSSNVKSEILKSETDKISFLKKSTRAKNNFSEIEKEKLENGEEDEMPIAQKIEEVFELERERTKNPITGEVPKDGLMKAIENTRLQQDYFEKHNAFFRGAIVNAKWQERGPSNVGGRTRAILVDLNDPTHKTIFAGGSTGGIFKNNNILDANAKWARVNDWMANLSISSLAQDQKNPKILYAGSGDCDGRDAQGNGIFKSTNGGNTWAQLPSTNNAIFQTNPSIVVLPDSGHVLAGTFKGLYKSRDGGASWGKVLGSGVDYGSALNDIYRIVRASDGTIYACTDNAVYKSQSNGDLNSWVNISQNGTFSKNYARCEIAVSPTNPNVVYAVGNIKNVGSVVSVTTDGGLTWTSGSQPVFIDGCGGAGTAVDFTRTQAWYDLTLAVSPLSEATVFVGGVDQFKSLDYGKTWKQISYWANCGTASKPFAHADQHAAFFDPSGADILYTGSDGGVFRNDSASTSNYNIISRNNNYVTTQFYGGAINPNAGVSQFLAGAQDNGTNNVKNGGVGLAQQVIGGDGFLTFIDQKNANYQFGSLYYGQWGFSKDAGKTFSVSAKSNADFLCPADYDSKKQILYAQTKDANLWMWDVSGKVPKTSLINVQNVTFNAGATNNIAVIKVDAYTDNRIYVGSKSGIIYQIENASDAANAKATIIGNLGGYIGGIDIDRNNTKHLLVTVSSYGVPHIFETKNGGANWSNISGNLPDMPVRDVLFSPNGDNKALIATDMGVWCSENLDSTRTVWLPPVPSRGTPLVRTSALKFRESDKTVLAATYGRGLFTSTLFATPSAVAEFFPISYVNVPTQFYAGSSGAANSYLWNFGDATTDTLETDIHTFAQIGTYNVKLSINKDTSFSVTKSIKILPKVPTPYSINAPNYTGDFETTDAPFGAYSASGSVFARGKSTVAGKDGTHSGNFAYVLGLKEQTYQQNTEAYLYMPLMDMSKSGIYTFSFWSLYDIQKGYDGFRVQYSLDKGTTWITLGSSSDNNWYDTNNQGVQGAFNNGDSYFSGTLDAWTKFRIDVSFLANNPDVALRFQFLSSNFLSSTGVAIDDAQLSIYEGAARTAFVGQSGKFTSSQTSIDFSFSVQPEYYSSYYNIETSTDGKNFIPSVTKIKPLSGVSGDLQTYTARWDGTPLDVYYARVVAYSSNKPTNYIDTIYSPTFVVRRSDDVTTRAVNIFPNPFGSILSLNFNDVISTPVHFQLYNDAGQLILDKTDTPNNVVYDLPTASLTNGIYFLSITLSGNKPQTFKVINNN